MSSCRKGASGALELGSRYSVCRNSFFSLAAPATNPDALRSTAASVVVLPIAVQSVRFELMCTATTSRSLSVSRVPGLFARFSAGDVASRRLGRCRGDCKGSLRRSFGMFLIATRTMCSPVPALLLGSTNLSSFVLECRANGTDGHRRRRLSHGIPSSRARALENARTGSGLLLEHDASARDDERLGRPPSRLSRYTQRTNHPAFKDQAIWEAFADDRTKLTRSLLPQTRFRQRDRYCFAVRVKADIGDRLSHDPFPTHRLLPDIRHNPRSPHAVRADRPISVERRLSAQPATFYSVTRVGWPSMPINGTTVVRCPCPSWIMHVE